MPSYITPSLVQADVVDIRNPTAAFPSDMVPDTNVLYWMFYANFYELAYAGGKQPKPYQVADYPKYWQSAAGAGTQFHVIPATLGEFAKAAEYAELETIWLTDSPPPQPDPRNPITQFDPRVCKFARYHYSRQLRTVRTAVEAMIVIIRNTVHLLPQFPSADDLHNHSVGEWKVACGDFPDAGLIASAKQQGILHILSDDIDFATFPGITLYTANLQTIQAASAAGKLV